MNGYTNLLPECPRCIGGRLLGDDRVRNKVCVNCGYRDERLKRHYRFKATRLPTDRQRMKRHKRRRKHKTKSLGV